MGSPIEVETVDDEAWSALGRRMAAASPRGALKLYRDVKRRVELEEQQRDLERQMVENMRRGSDAA